MKTTYGLTMAALATVLAISMPSYAISTSEDTENSAVPTAPVMTSALVGSVQNVDFVNNSVLIQDPAGIVANLRVDGGTQISREGKSVNLSQLVTGDVVVIQNAALM